MQYLGERVYGSNTIFFVPKSQVPQDQKVKYVRIVCDIKSQKYETNKIRLTVGVNPIEYPGKVTTITTYSTTSKTLINSTISTPDVILFWCRHIKLLS